MKSKVTYSKFSSILTAVIFFGLFIGCFLKLREERAFFLLLAVFILLLIFSFLYGAVYVKADTKYIYLGSILKNKKILIENIESIESFQPTMGAIRICGCNGFMGYWGLFKEWDIGRYYAFYGKSSSCFLIRMKNGDKYVIGCDSPDKMIEFIKAQMSNDTFYN